MIFSTVVNFKQTSFDFLRDKMPKSDKLTYLLKRKPMRSGTKLVKGVTL